MLNDKKIPVIPPLFHNNNFISDFKEKSELFNEHFSEQCLNQDIFPAEWKKANVVPLYMKGDHQCVKNYRPVSLLPMFSKIFERLIYNAMFKHFLDNNFLSSNQSAFKPGVSCINQLTVLTHDISKGFDDGLDAFFLIHLKLLTKCGMRNLFINYVVMVFVEIYCKY